MLFVYEDAEKRKQFKDKYCDYKFVGPSFFIRDSDNLNDILYLVEDEHYDHLIVDISNWIKDGNFYKVYFERFLAILLDNVDDIHFCIKESLLDEFLQWFPDFFDEKDGSNIGKIVLLVCAILIFLAVIFYFITNFVINK